MKEKIHPRYEVVQVHCACGETFSTRSTRKEIRVEICSSCHPFFTGRQKLVDSAGRVERFTKRYTKEAVAAGAAKRTKKTEKAQKTAAARAAGRA